jgi:hypothetical protein
MHCVFPPFEPPDGGRPRFSRLVVVGGTQIRGSRYLSAIVRLQGFSSGSPAASPRRWSPKTVTSSSVVGRSESGCDLGSALSFKDLRHPSWGGSRAEPELYLLHGSVGHLFFQLLVVETILQLCGGGILQPCRGRQTVAAQLGCNIPSSVLAFAARTEVRACRCGVGGQADVAVGVDVVAAGESFSAVGAVSAAYGPTSGSFGFDSLSSPLEWGRGQGARRGSVRPEVIAAVVWPLRSGRRRATRGFVAP